MTSAVGAPGVLVEPGPVFLAGADRSGVGLLGELLERHPRIAMTRRVDFWTRYWGRFGDLADPDNVDRCLRALAADRRGKIFAPDRDRVLTDLAARPTYAALFASVQQQRMERLGRVRWGDKSLGSERYAERILACFPTARVLHVVRDPRDRYASYRQHRGGGRGGVGAGAAVWRSSVRLAERHVRRHPDRYRVVRYESLVADPERTLRAVCSFIGERYEASLLQPELRSPQAVDGSDTSDGPGTIHERSVGRFRDALTQPEIGILQLAAGRRRLARLGYEVEALELSAAAMWRFRLVDLPIHVAVLLLWDPWTRARVVGAPPRPRA